MPFDALTAHIESFAAGGEGGIIGLTGGEIFLYRHGLRCLGDVIEYVARRRYPGALMINLQTGGYSPKIPGYRELAARIFSHGLNMELATSFNLFRPAPEVSLAETINLAKAYAGGLTVNAVIDRNNAERTCDALFDVIRQCLETAISAGSRQKILTGLSNGSGSGGIRFRTASGFWMFIKFSGLQAAGAAEGSSGAFRRVIGAPEFPWQKMVRSDGRVFCTDSVWNLSE